jgi:phosphatidylserine/phosphatidylglycerophosphate/cardiolipin synthase-like enzyme
MTARPRWLVWIAVASIAVTIGISIWLLTSATTIIAPTNTRPTTAASRAEAHLAAVANPICRYIKVQEGLPLTPSVEANMSAAETRFRALLRSEQDLHRVATLRSDTAATERVLAALLKAAKRGVPSPHERSYEQEVDRLTVKIRANLKALGLNSCIRPPLGRPRKPIAG